MWICPGCNRIFERDRQTHSCNRVPLEEHFKNKDKAKKLFDYLYALINKEIGQVKIISLPCCIHLFGKYDFLAALPKKDKLEIRFSLDRKIANPRIKMIVPMSSKMYKNCFEVNSKEQLNREFIDWLKESYYLKDRK